MKKNNTAITDTFNWSKALEQSKATALKTINNEITTLNYSTIKQSLQHDTASDFSNTMGLFIQECEESEAWPSLLSLIYYLSDNLELDETQGEFQALLLAAHLGDVPNTQKYHGNSHYVKVLLSVTRQIHMHNALCTQEHRLSSSDKCLLLTAACIHDLGHNGLGNQGSPFLLEQRALDIYVPFISSLNISENWLEDLKTVVLCTDVSSSTLPETPADQLKSGYTYYVLKKGSLPTFYAEITRLNNNPKLCILGLLFHEADLMPSLVYGSDLAERETYNLALERNIQSPNIQKSYRFFVDTIFQNFITPAGKTNTAIARRTIDQILKSPSSPDLLLN